MQKLKNSDRQLIIESVLTASFKPRFGAVVAALREAVKAQIVSENPVFFKLMKTASQVPYLKRATLNTAYFRGINGPCRFALPLYGKDLSTTEGVLVTSSQGREYLNLGIEDMPVLDESVYLGECTALELYALVWDDYANALETLKATLARYYSVEDLKADFPEWAALVPMAAQPAATVDPSAVRETLAGLGVK